MKRISIIILLVSLLVLLIGLAIDMVFPNMEPAYKLKELSFPLKGSSLYFKSKTWGLTYDHKVIVLSAGGNEKFSPDSTRDFVYPGADFLYYKLKGDSLILYVYSKCSEPQNFGSKVKVMQVEMENSEMIKLRQNRSYENIGLGEFQ